MRVRPSRLLLLALAALAILASAAGPTAAAPTSDLLYSTDGGASWSSSATVAPGGSLLVRHWFDNDGVDGIDGSSISTSAPSGFTVDTAGTEVCLNPSTTDPTAPSATEEICSTAGSAVWSGSDLTVSPSAGFFGASPTAATGTLAQGRQRYLTLMNCNENYARGANRETVSGVISTDYLNPTRAVDDVQVFTQAWSINAGLSCALRTTGAYGSTPSGASQFGPYGAQAIQTLGKQQLTIDECFWTFANGRSVSSSIDPTSSSGGGLLAYTGFQTGTVLSTSAPSGAPTCGPGAAGTTALGSLSRQSSFDIMEGRYLRIAQCRWETIATSPRHWITTWASNSGPGGSRMSPTPTDVSSWDCTNPDPTTYQADSSGQAFSGATNIDMLDTTRAHGYVEYAMTAPATPSAEDCEAGLDPYDQAGELTGDGGLSVASTGTITVSWPAGACPVDPIPLVDPVFLAGAGLLATGAVVVTRRRRLA